jgi:L-asparaginase
VFIKFLTTGGTIDKIYFDDSSRFEVGESQVEHILREALVDIDYEVVSLLRKDSLDIDEADRARIRDYIERDSAERYVITHGTDTMVKTALALDGLGERVIVLTGALSPARFRSTDAVFNVGMATAAAQTLGPGVYIAMSGTIFAADQVVKNREKNRFESIARRDAG